ncbi:MAG: RNA-binding domain-containing protein [Candidatus Methanoperedens sp.]
MNVHNVSLRAFIQATEGEDRVKTALSLFLFDGEIKTVKTEGHFGNPVTILHAHVKGRNCRRFIELLKSKLPEHELDRLKNELDERIDDDCCLHIRFDKQAAYNGIVQLAATTDTIAAEIKLKAFPARRENAIAAAEEIL